MPRPTTGLNTVSRKLLDGSTERRWYHRKSGLLIGSSREGWTKQQALLRAQQIDQEADSSAPAPGTFGALCVAYLGSQRFAKLAPRTQSEYRDHIEVLRGMWEEVPYVGITRKAVKAMLAGFADRPWRGNALVRTLSAMWSHGLHELELEGLPANPAAHIEMHETRPRTQIWDAYRIEVFLDAAHQENQASVALSMALLLYTVQRLSDALEMERPMLFERDGRPWIRLRQAKTGELVDVPCHQRLAAELARSPGQAGLLIPSPTGKPWTRRNFSRSWDRVRRRANWRLAREAIRARGGLPPRSQVKARRAALAEVRAAMLDDLQRRDLRRTGMVMMALAGATALQIAAVSGHRIDRVQAILDTYIPRRGEIGLGAIEAWERSSAQLVVLPRPAKRA